MVTNDHRKIRYKSVFGDSVFFLHLTDFSSSFQLTDFNVIMESEFNKLKSDFVSVPQSDPLYRKFKESVWVY